jgi:hypothetical protein
MIRAAPVRLRRGHRIPLGLAVSDQMVNLVSAEVSARIAPAAGGRGAQPPPILAWSKALGYSV